VILAGTAALHGSGYPEVEAAVAASDIEGVLSGAIGGLWLFASIHWLFLAVLAVVATTLASRATTCVLGLVVAVLAADIVLLLVHVGPFMGEVMLGAAALAYASGAWLSSSPLESNG
jgi:hypothetical protein